MRGSSIIKSESESNNCKRAEETLIYDETGMNYADDEVAIEEPLEIYIDGIRTFVTMRLPGEEIPLALGYCFSQGIIDSIDDVLLARYCNLVTGNRVELTLGRRLKPDRIAKLRRRTQVSYSSCGICGDEMIDDVCVDLAKRESSFSVSTLQLAEMLARVEEGQSVFLETGGTHGAGFFDKNGELLVFSEDTGRHNALDKCLGKLILQKKLGQEMVIALTSRISFEMVQKICRCNAQVLLGVSAATSLALDLAQRAEVTLVGFVRGRRGVVYCGAHRIRFDGETARPKARFVPVKRTDDRRKANTWNHGKP
jgi:FdhD protein